MTKDQINAKKAELLDEFLSKFDFCFLDSRYFMSKAAEETLILKDKFDTIPTARTYTEDPYVDDIVGGRLYNLIQDCYFALTGDWKRDIRVSELPTLQEMETYCRNFGKKTKSEFNELKKKYEL